MSTYSDIDALFTANPNTGDLSIKTDDNAIKFAVKNLILTKNYERPFDSSIGSQVHGMLFEQMDAGTIVVLKKMIENTLTNHEPRIELINIDIEPDEDDNSLSISIYFRIKNTTKSLNVSFVLDRTR